MNYQQNLKFILTLCYAYERYIEPSLSLQDILESSTSDRNRIHLLIHDYLSYYSKYLKSHIFRNFLPSPTQCSKALWDSIKHIISTPTPSPSEFAQQYEKIVASSLSRNKQGAFYTPPEIAHYMAHAIDLRSRPSILDPACGSGIFLITLAERLYKEHGAKSREEKRTLVKQCLYGVDRNPQASEVARLCVLLSTLVDTPHKKGLPEDTLNTNFRCGNTLISRQQDPLGVFKGFSFNAAFGHTSFDVIIANPPYGLSRNEQIPPHEKGLIKKIYKETLSGKPNKYLLFLTRCLSLLSEKGQLCFLIPNSWLGIRSGKKVRELLLRNKLITSIDTFGQYLFADAGVEVILLNASRHHRSDSFEVRTLSPSLHVQESYEVGYDYAYRLHDHYIPINWNSAVLKSIEELQRDSTPLASVYHPTIALQAYATGKGIPAQTPEMVKEHIYHSTTKSDETYYRYLAGKDVRRFSLSWSGSYLRYGKWLADPQPLDRYTTPRVIVREILGEPPYLFQAYYTDAPYLYNKSLLHITAHGEDKIEKLLALTAILNSRLASFLIQFLGKKSARRLFPKIVLDDLKHLPLPSELEKYTAGLAALTKAAQSAGAEEIQPELDEMVYKAYNVSAKTRETIRKFTKSRESGADLATSMPHRAEL